MLMCSTQNLKYILIKHDKKNKDNWINQYKHETATSIWRENRNPIFENDLAKSAVDL